MSKHTSSSPDQPKHDRAERDHRANNREGKPQQSFCSRAHAEAEQWSILGDDVFICSRYYRATLMAREVVQMSNKSG